MNRRDRNKGRFFALTPNRWHARGEALCQVEGRKPFLVWQGIPGEESRVRLIHQGQHQMIGRYVGSDKPHPDRVEPHCDRYALCGGCPLMHINDAGQLRERRAIVQHALDDEGLKVEVDPVVAAPEGTSNFRHVIKLGVAYSDQGRTRIGAFGRRTRSIVPIPHCPVTTPELRELMGTVAYHAHGLDVRPWEPGHGGLLRYVVARQSKLTGEILVTLVAGKNHKLLRQLATAVEESHGQVSGVHLHINDGPGNAIFARDGQGIAGTSRLVGSRTITERLAQVDYNVGPGDFFQTHPAMADVLYRHVIELAEAREGLPVVDLYSGVGGFALALAPRTGWALGVESNEGAVQRARDAASAAIPAEFVCGEVLDVLPDVAKRLTGRRPLVIVDPARRGLEPGVVPAMLDLHPRRIVYISCNPRAMARDLAGFVERGWSIGTVRPFDMFPHTAHVEVVAVLDAPDADEAPQTRGPRRKVVR